MNRILVFFVALTLSCAALAKDAAFDSFWSKFRNALQKNDKEAIASMTRLPYGSYEKPMNKKEFLAHCDKIFSKKIRDCLLKQKPVQDKNTYSCFCGEEIYIFEKTNGNFVFTEIGVND